MKYAVLAIVLLIALYFAITHFVDINPNPSATCKDMTVSFSTKRMGTCSYHGGVLKWAHK